MCDWLPEQYWVAHIGAPSLPGCSVREREGRSFIAPQYIDTFACAPTDDSLVKLQLLMGLLAHIRIGVDHHCAGVQSGQW